MIKYKDTKSTMMTRVPPYAHQARAFEFAMDKLTEPNGGGVALLMEMGTGKTLVAIAVAGELYRRGLIRKVLIVAPLSVLSVWESEFSGMAAFPFGFTLLSGNLEKKRNALKNIPKENLQIVAVNYESSWRLATELLEFAPDMMIADEGHRIKDGQTKQSRAIHNIAYSVPYKMLLTGTVITNKELDVFSQYRFINPSIFGDSFYRFRNRYFDMTGYGYHVPRFREYMREEFLEKLHSVAYRVTKEECLDLPETLEEIRKVQLEPPAMRIYKSMEKESYVELGSSEVSAVNILSRLLRLSQITGGHIIDDDRHTRKISNAKLVALNDVIDSALADNGKLVIMARFIPELDEIENLLKKKKTEYAVIRGGTKERENQVFKFQNDPNCKVFLGQIATAGLGLTLTASHTMCFYSLDYSMSNFEQAKARIHRVGQKNTCHYIYLVVDKTVDTKVLKALRNKTDLARALVDEWRKGINPFLV